MEHAMLKKIMSIVFCVGLMCAEAQTKYPFLSAEFKEIYDELRNQEDEVIEKFEKRYQKIPKEAWKILKILQKDGFVYIKKEYEGTPTCVNLPNSVQENWTHKDFDRFIEQYTKCRLEKNGIDPKKINLYYNYNDIPYWFKASPGVMAQTQGFSSFKGFLDYKDFFTHHTTCRPALFVNKKKYNDIEMVDYALTGIDYVSSKIAELFDSRLDILNGFIEQYYGADELKTTQHIRLKNELNIIYSQNAFIIAAMRSEDAANNWCECINKNFRIPLFEFKVGWGRVLRYLYRIQKIFQILHS
jgi:hypothetical protein